MEILQSSPPNCEEAEIYPDGQYKYIQDNASVPGNSAPNFGNLTPSCMF